MSAELGMENCDKIRTLAPKSSPRRRMALLRNYAAQVVTAARQRAKERGLPCDIDTAFVEQLMAENRWRCAISGVELVPQTRPGEKISPFAPSLDRIVPAKGYTRGNVRVVCYIVNCAMNEWGFETLMQLFRAIRRNGSAQRVKKWHWNADTRK